MVKKAVLAGSFDPITIGHLDLCMRTCAMFEDVVLLVCNNAEKHYLFTAEERLVMAKQSVQSLCRVHVEKWDGLLADYVKSVDGVLVRGIRNGMDADYEISLAQINNHLCDCETVLLPVRAAYSYISSSYVRELIRYGKDLQGAVPAEALPQILKKQKMFCR